MLLLLIPPSTNFPPDDMTPCEADTFFLASFSRLAGNLLLVRLRVVSFSWWQLAGRYLLPSAIVLTREPARRRRRHP